MLQAKHKNIATALEFYHMTRRQRSDEIALRLYKSLNDLRLTRYVIQILGAWFSTLQTFLTRSAGEINVVSLNWNPAEALT